MGDRALVVFTDGKDVSPVVYLHWNGTEVPEWLNELKSLMVGRATNAACTLKVGGRASDLNYTTARFIGICHSHISGNLSLGTWSTPEPLRQAVLCNKTGVLTDESHGDAGFIVVNVNDGLSYKAYGGYLEDEKARV